MDWTTFLREVTGPVTGALIVIGYGIWDRTRTKDNSDTHRLDAMEREVLALREQVGALQRSDDTIRVALENQGRELSKTREEILTALARLEGKMAR